MNVRSLKRELEEFHFKEEEITREMFFEFKLIKYLEKLEQRVEDLEKGQ